MSNLNLSIDNKIVNSTEGNSIIFHAQNSELLKITEDGFYVRGKKLEIDDNEAKSVYKAFREFLVWAALVRE